MRRAALGLALAAALYLPAAAATLSERGRYYWTSDTEGFGGFSGLLVDEGGLRIRALSDRGRLFEAAVMRQPRTGRIEGLKVTADTALLSIHGTPVEDFLADAEAIAQDPAGRLYIAFEGYARIERYDTAQSIPRRQHRRDRFWWISGNTGFESLAARPGGGLLTIHQVRTEGDPSYATFLSRARRGSGDPWRIVDWDRGPALPEYDGFEAADAAFGPDGRLYLLERRFAMTAGFVTRIRRFAYDGKRFDRGETLLETEPGDLENMEGLSLWTDPWGRTILTLVSDDGFLPFLNTLVIEYILTD